MIDPDKGLDEPRRYPDEYDQFAEEINKQMGEE